MTELPDLPAVSPAGRCTAFLGELNLNDAYRRCLLLSGTVNQVDLQWFEHLRQATLMVKSQAAWWVFQMGTL